MSEKYGNWILCYVTAEKWNCKYGKVKFGLCRSDETTLRILPKKNLLSTAGRWDCKFHVKETLLSDETVNWKE